MTLYLLLQEIQEAFPQLVHLEAPNLVVKAWPRITTGTIVLHLHITGRSRGVAAKIFYLAQ